MADNDESDLVAAFCVEGMPQSSSASHPDGATGDVVVVGTGDGDVTGASFGGSAIEEVEVVADERSLPKSSVSPQPSPNVDEEFE